MKGMNRKYIFKIVIISCLLSILQSSFSIYINISIGEQIRNSDLIIIGLNLGLILLTRKVEKIRGCDS